MPTINIDTSAFVVLTNKLDKLQRSALPSAIRGTLNKAAFDVKQNTMAASASKHFIKRKPNFFKANSRVDMASGFDITSMRATVGFIARGGNNYTNQAVKELEQQERGGDITHRSYIPLDSARTGESHSGMVRPNSRLSSIKGIINSANVVGSSNKEKFIKAALLAGKGGFVIGNNPKKILYEIRGITRIKGRMLKIKTKPLYSFSQGRSVDISATHFMREATLKTVEKMPSFYANEAERQFKRFIK